MHTARVNLAPPDCHRTRKFQTVIPLRPPFGLEQDLHRYKKTYPSYEVEIAQDQQISEIAATMCNSDPHFG